MGVQRPSYFSPQVNIQHGLLVQVEVREGFAEEVTLELEGEHKFIQREIRSKSLGTSGSKQRRETGEWKGGPYTCRAE